MSEVGAARGGFSGIPGIGSKTKKSGEKQVSTHRKGVPDVHPSPVSTKPRDLSTHGVKHRANLEGDKAGHKIGGFPIYGPLTREETEKVEHNDTMEREDRDRLMSLLQSKGLISKDGIYSGPGIFQYFTDKNGGVDRLIESINESDTSYTPDGKTRLYAADKDGITINFKVRGDYKVNSEEMKGTELIKLNSPLKLSWNDVVVWATEKPYSDRSPLPNGELPAENLMYLFFPEFENTSSLSGSKSKNIQSVLMNGCKIYETRFLYLEGTAFKYVKAQLEEKIASFEKKGNEKGAAGAKNALQYLDLVRDWASKNEVSSEDSLDKKLPENVLKVLDRIITDAGEAKVSDKELQQADLLLKIITPETIDEADRFSAGIKSGSSFNTKNIEAADFVGQLENIPNKNKITDIAKNDALNKAFKDIKDAAKSGVDGADYSKIGKGDINKNKNIDLPQGDVFGKFLKDVKDGKPTDVKPLDSKLAGKAEINKRVAANKNRIADGVDVGDKDKTSEVSPLLKYDLGYIGGKIKAYLSDLKAQKQGRHLYVTTERELERELNYMNETVSDLQRRARRDGVENAPYVVNMMKSIEADVQEIRKVGSELLKRTEAHKASPLLKFDLKDVNEKIQTHLNRLKDQQKVGTASVKNKESLRNLLKGAEKAVNDLQRRVEMYEVKSDPYVVNMMKSIEAGMQELRSVGNELLNRPRWG